MAKKVPFFMCLLNSIGEMMGSDMSKGILQRVGENIASSLIEKFGKEKVEVENLSDLLKDDNPLNYFDDTLGISDGKLFILEKCPFSEVLNDFLELHSSMPSIMNEITDSYNAEGLGYAVSPYCVIHQTFRSELAKSIKIGGKSVKLSQLGCKAKSGTIKFADDNIIKSGLTEDAVKEKLASGACIYTIEVEQ